MPNIASILRSRDEDWETFCRNLGKDTDWLQGVDLSGANLRCADLSKVNLSGTNLSRAILTNADLTRADLTGANLAKASLANVRLDSSNLSGADLTGANLSGADLRYANLRGTKGLKGSLEETLAFVNRVIEGHLTDQQPIVMSDWHVSLPGHPCGTAHCIAGSLLPHSLYPGEEASLIIPELTYLFYESQDYAISELSRIAAGDIDHLCKR